MSDEGKEALMLVRNLIRVGRVSKVDSTNGTVDVLFEDMDNLIASDLPVMESCPFPEVHDQVLCVFIGVDLTDGYCLGGFYSKENPPPIIQGR
jgi:phage baseplate assembly protein gpV